MKAWLIQDIARSAFRHGQGYAQGNIYRSTGRYLFKCPEACLPDWVVQLPLEDHEFLCKLYRHAFRQGLKSSTKEQA